MTRENGFYWIKYKKSDWIIAEWDQEMKGWWLCGLIARLSDEVLTEIDETKIERNEK